ncbi:MAG: hypothetical protein RIG68_26550 [Imperialibacter sp.]|uniref:hypothetical protein n=1 Tax=Imperialibacter sp. TaxID=2038411 RepID=UPI0032EE7951
MSEKYKYDIAISLCKQDVEFARKLTKALNPGLKVFFYEDKQEELVSRSGPEAFAGIFKNQSRVVVILSRKEWSETFYTEIERNGIIDRTSVKNEGYNFLMVIPMERGEIPGWYPSTRIYIDPRRFTIEEIARFIEFKVTEEGGVVRRITLEERYQLLLDRMDAKRSFIERQSTEDAIVTAKSELIILRDSFNVKIEILLKDSFEKTVTQKFHKDSRYASFSIGAFFLECRIDEPDSLYERVVDAQDFKVTFGLYKVFGSDESTSNKIIEKESRLFYHAPQLYGWSVPFLHGQVSGKEPLVLFRDRRSQEFYDLKKPIKTEAVVDLWFQKLLENYAALIERYL